MKLVLAVGSLAFLGLVGCSSGSDTVEASDDVATTEQAVTARGTWVYEHVVESCHDLCASTSCTCVSPRTTTNPTGKFCAPLGAHTWYVVGAQVKGFRCQK